MLYPDSMFGTDSHTTMINGIGVLGWGVGGIEAEAAMLGEASFFPVPEVIGVRLTGKLPKIATATDLALKVTQVLRQEKLLVNSLNTLVTVYQILALPNVQLLPIWHQNTVQLADISQLMMKRLIICV